MKYIVPAESLLWDKQRDALKNYSDDVIFIRYSSQPEDEQTGYGKQLICEIQSVPGKDEDIGIGSRKYESLLSHKDVLLTMIGDDSVTILSDMDPESLYPYRLLMDADEYKGGLHMVGAIPFRFLAKRKVNSYKDMIWDTGRTDSVAILNSDSYIETLENRNITIPQLLRDIGSLLLKPLSAVSGLRVSDTDASTFFQYDFICGKYYLTDRDNYPYSNHKRPKEIRLAGIGPRPERRDGKEKAPVPPPVPDGRELCRELKSARIELARANGIPFESHDCSSEAECGGTCEACDEELRYLNQEMEKIPEDQRKYPEIL